MNIALTTSNDTLSLSARIFVDATPLIRFYMAFNGLCEVDESPCNIPYERFSVRLSVGARSCTSRDYNSCYPFIFGHLAMGPVAPFITGESGTLKVEGMPRRS